MKKKYQNPTRGSYVWLRKPLKIMKLTFFLILVSAMLVSAGSYSQNTKLSLNYRNIQIGQLLQLIEKQTQYRFAYSKSKLNPEEIVSIEVKDGKLDQILKAILDKDQLTYNIIDRYVVISDKNSLLEVNSLPQNQKNVTGKVSDLAGLPLPGVSVVIKGTTTGSITDTNGTYTISNIPANAILQFSFVGMRTQEVKVGTQSVINVSLEEETIGIEEVVAVGYGTSKRSDITGAMSSVSTKSLKIVPVTNAQQILQGRAAGVYVTQSSNKPGAEPSVLIRGRRSFSAGNDPLYVIDGIPITGGFNDISPNDIESMQVLKDASATAIYGSRGANGVIIITTKRGTSGSPATLTYNGYLGVTKVTRHVDVMNGDEFVEFKREAARAAGTYDDTNPTLSDSKIFEVGELDAIANKRYTPWHKLITQDGFSQNHELSIQGGTKATRYNISFNYFDDKGYFKCQDFTRYNTRVNLDQDISSRVKIGLSMLGSYSERNGGGIEPYMAAVVQTPLGSAYDESGNIKEFPTGDALMYNPLANFEKGAIINLEKRFRLLTSMYGEAELYKGLKFRINFGPDLINSRIGNFAASKTTTNQGGLPSANSSESFVFSYTLENILTYDKLFGNKHKVNFTGLYSIQDRALESSNMGVKDLPVESIEYFNMGAAKTITGVGSNYEKWTILSYMGRLNYSFDNRFLLTLTGRADGSSRFAPGHKWGFFPSAALAYNIGNENFMKTIAWLSSLKVRTSYGTTGNTGINPYQTQGLLGSTAYDFNGVAASGRYPNTIRNENLKWESTASLNGGIDFGFLNNRISGSFEAYRSTTTDLLLPRVLPNSTGFSSVLTNVGSTRNTGFELTLSTRNIVSTTNGFEWTSDFIMANNHEEILELSQGKVDDVGNARFIGQPISVVYDYQKIGIWQTGEEALAKQFSSSVGQIKIADRNNNGKIDPDDRMILGSTTPKWTYSFNNYFSYKGFDLSIFLVARTGNLISSTFHKVPNNSIALGGRYNGLNVDYWTPKNPTNNYPRPIYGQSGNPGPVFGSTLQWFDGSFLRVRNINFGYNVPSTIAQKIKAKSLRIYVNITDPYIFSSYVHKYRGIDPEVNDNPATINCQLGLNVKF